MKLYTMIQCSMQRTSMFLFSEMIYLTYSSSYFVHYVAKSHESPFSFIEIYDLDEKKKKKKKENTNVPYCVTAWWKSDRNRNFRYFGPNNEIHKSELPERTLLESESIAFEEIG